MSATLAIDQDNHRRAPRRSMFVSAILSHSGQAFPVRIRNMSTNGAMIEANDLPPAGSDVLLARGSLSVNGHIAWLADGSCGIALAEEVDVATWTAKPINPRQEEIDRIVALHQGGAAPAKPVTPAKRRGPDKAEITATREEISKLGELLIADPELVARHGEALQLIDRAEQMLDALAKQLPS